MKGNEGEECAYQFVLCRSVLFLGLGQVLLVLVLVWLLRLDDLLLALGSGRSRNVGHCEWTRCRSGLLGVAVK
jgi:hypothetical protein